MQGRWPLTLPIRFTATRVTGVGEAAGGILHRLSAAGELRITPREIMGQGLALRSDKLAGRLNLHIDLTNGRYDVGLDGALQRYLIPGLGIVDVTSRLTAVPGPDGHGTRVVGRGEARVRRLDNAFLRSLAGGLPHLTTDLERGTDGVFHFHGLVLTGPDIRLTGEAIRRRDGTFHFVGGGRQRRYGPVQLVLDGRIDKPTLDLLLAAPNAAMGLSDVRAHLDPTDQGFRLPCGRGLAAGAVPGERRDPVAAWAGGGDPDPAAAGGGCPRDRRAQRRSGRLCRADGRFRGGLSGELLFRPVGEVQRIEAHLAARQAEISGVTVRQAVST